MELSKEEIICGTNEHKRDEMVGKDDFTDSRSSDSRSTVPTWGSFNVIRGDTNRERLDKVAAHPETANQSDIVAELSTSIIGTSVSNIEIRG